MIGDLLLAVGSFVGLLAYASVAVAAARIASARMQRCCEGCQAWQTDPSPYLGYRFGHPPSTHNEGAAYLGAFWPLVAAGAVFWRIGCFIAKGPTLWGARLAGIATQHDEKRRERELVAAQRTQRIAELERELGIGAGGSGN